MPSQLVLADLQKQIAQGVRNAYIKSFALKKKKMPFWKNGFFLFHPLTPLISIGKNTPDQNKSSQKEN